MHPDPSTRFADDPAGLAQRTMLDWAAARGFAHIFASTADGPMVAHAPITAAPASPDGDAFRFHVARANRIARHLDGAHVLLSLSGCDGYISPSWYADPLGARHVPTWNYVAVEITGTARKVDDAGLTEQLDRLAAVHEPRVSPELQWTRAKTDPVFFDKLRKGIVGFEVRVDSVRGTTKLSRNKPAADIAGVVEGLARSGNPALAEAMARL